MVADHRAVPDRATKSPVGQPFDRIDGPAKVTGKATYAYEYREGGRLAYGHIVGASIGKGRIREIDAEAAERAPGVLHVMTHRNAPPQPDFGPVKDPERLARAEAFLSSDRVRYFGEPVALVIAETFEAARAAAGLIKVRYEKEHGVFDFRANLDKAYKPETINVGLATDTALGDFEGAFAAAAVTVDSTYGNAYQNHNPIEPHAAIAMWSGDELTVYMGCQTLSNARAALAKSLRLPPEQVRVVTRYLGGGFGGKLGVRAETILAAFASRELRRPVKVAQTRQQMFANTGHRPAFVQRIRLAATPDGRLDAIGHEVWSPTARFDEFAEQTAAFTRSLYAAPNRMTRHRLVAIDKQSGDPMRAPGEAPGMLAFECVMDELAVKLGIDPVELRIRNEPAEDPERKVPFSSRNLIACMREGAARFGWDKRPAQPASRHDGRFLIGYGMSAAIRPNYLRPAKALARLEPDGTLTARLDMTDIGNGSYTILAQIAAEAMGIPIDKVRVQLGDTRFPKTPGSGGSFGAASAGSALHNACLKLKQKVFEAGGPPSVAVEAEGEIAPGETYKTYSQHGFGAFFAEVGVDADTAEIRLRRMLGVFAAGRILNPKTARSQMIGGMIWGVSSALHEEGVMDPRHGHFVNHDLAEYHVPVNADVPNVDAFFLDEQDDKGNPLGIKGIGELGICGAGASIGNAVYNATGVRVREFPITLDKLLPDMPLSSI